MGVLLKGLIHLRDVEEGGIAERVVIAGDPSRVEQVKGLLRSPKLVNRYRGLTAYSGIYEGVPMSIVTHGMGVPSVLIVAEELIKAGAKAIVRLGSCGAFYKGSRVGDLVIPTGCVYYPGGAYYQYLNEHVCGPTSPDYMLTSNLVQTAKESGLRYKLGPVLTSDAFYAESKDFARKWLRRGVLAVEMECAGLFLLGNLRGVKASALLIVSDSLIEDIGFASAGELEEYASKAAEAALKALLKLDVKG